jgi:hypothetical protein
MPSLWNQMSLSRPKLTKAVALSRRFLMLASSQAQSGSAQYQDIYQRIQSVPYVAVLNQDRHIDDGRDKKNQQPDPCCRQTHSLVYKQADAGNNVDDPRYISPRQIAWNRSGHQPLERDGWNKFGMKKVLHSEENDGNSNENARWRNKPIRALGSPFFRFELRQKTKHHC